MADWSVTVQPSAVTDWPTPAADGGFAARVPKAPEQKMRSFDSRDEREISLKPSGSITFSVKISGAAVPVKMIGGRPYALARDLAQSLGMKYIPPNAGRTAEIIDR